MRAPVGGPAAAAAAGYPAAAGGAPGVYGRNPNAGAEPTFFHPTEGGYRLGNF